MANLRISLETKSGTFEAVIPTTEASLGNDLESFTLVRILSKTGRKIDAIKVIRAFCGIPLKDAKTASEVETLFTLDDLRGVASQDFATPGEVMRAFADELEAKGCLIVEGSGCPENPHLAAEILAAFVKAAGLTQ